jgi:signal transduction histidine kinase
MTGSEIAAILGAAAICVAAIAFLRLARDRAALIREREALSAWMAENSRNEAAARAASAAKTRFLATISHEMRTPLNGVAGFADVLAGRPGLDAEAVRQVRQIRASSDGLLMLVEDILDFARGDDALTNEPLDLAEAARETVTANLGAALARGLNLHIDDRLPAQARFIADRRALRQALHPLVANAVKFTDRGEIVVRLDRADDGVFIRVSDTGCGIDPSILPDLFEAFAQGDASIRRSRSFCRLADRTAFNIN